MDDIMEEMVDSILRADSEHLDELLQTDENVWKRLTTFIDEGELPGQTLLHLAADKSRNDCVRVILSQVESTEQKRHLCNLHEKNEYGRIPLHTVLDGGCRCQDCSAKNIDCVEILLEEGSDVNSRDHDNGETPLAYAANYMMDECASLLLEHGADASIQFVPPKSRAEGKQKPVILYEYIAQKIPGALTALLDKGITTSEKDSSILNLDFKVFLSTREKEDVGGLISRARETETDILVCMANAHSTGKELLLTHPMTLAFLHFKWSLVRKFVLCIQLSYFIMMAIYTYFVLEAFDSLHHLFGIGDDGEDEGTTTEDTTASDSYLMGKLIRDTDDGEEDVKDRTVLTILASFVCLWWAFMVLNEFYEMSQGMAAYVKVRLNFAWWVLIICVGISVPPGFNLRPELWQLPIAAFSVFLAWGLTLVQTSRFPSLGIYIEMLGKVVADFALFLVTFAALLIGFALAFHVLFPEDEMFSNVATSFVKVVLIMIGETDYETIFEEMVDPKIEMLGLEYTIPAHVLFVGFIFVITIVLMNLLLGLAVSDIQELKKVATVVRVNRQIEQIQLFESLMRSKFIPTSLSRWGMHNLSIMKILENHDLESTTSLRFCPTDPDDKSLPKDLKEAFIDHVLDKPCINLPNNLGAKLKSENPENQQGVDKSDRKKRLRRLEDKVNLMQDTLDLIHNQLLELQSK